MIDKKIGEEKEISANIEKLQNQKIEVIFEQVKKEVKIENLNVSSDSIIPLLEVLRSKPQVADNNKIEESANKPADFFSKENPKTGNISSRLDSITDVVGR